MVWTEADTKRLRNQDGNWYVPYTNWDGDQFNRNANWLSNDWNSNYRVVLLVIRFCVSNHKASGRLLLGGRIA